MSLDLLRPITYLVTSGRTTSLTTPRSPEFLNLLKLIEAAVVAEVSLIQLREKKLSIRVLEELGRQATALTRASNTKLLINERFDVALATGADGVHLTSQSISTEVVRKNVGDKFLIGVSTHLSIEVSNARDSAADFALFGPIFETESKREFGPPQGIETLRQLTDQMNGFPVIAIGGINKLNANECLQAGASGIAGISLFEDESMLSGIVKLLRAYA